MIDKCFAVRLIDIACSITKSLVLPVYPPSILARLKMQELALIFVFCLAVSLPCHKPACVPGSWDDFHSSSFVLGVTKELISPSICKGKCTKRKTVIKELEHCSGDTDLVLRIVRSPV